MTEDNKPLFTIGVVAELISVSVQTLRLWEQKELIFPTRKGKDRYYSQKDLERLRYIKMLLTERKLNTYGVREILEKEGWNIARAAEPQPDDQEAETAPSKKNTPAFADQKRILIIDDDFDYVTGLKAILESDGYLVTVALSGRDGVDKAIKEKPSLIVLDIMIPDLDGMEVCKQIKSVEDLKNTIVVAHSNIPQTMRGKFGITDDSMPADEFTEKPVQPRVFLEKIRVLLS